MAMPSNCLTPSCSYCLPTAPTFFEKGIFYDYLELTTEEDGSELAATLTQLFEVLNTPQEKRRRNINESLNAFP
ncbi:MAG: SAM-dependent methyltransferase [Segetibacter sp.]|nr:SAM-dependent methyltransferase [Segetibacter sp.]